MFPNDDCMFTTIQFHVSYVGNTECMQTSRVKQPCNFIPLSVTLFRTSCWNQRACYCSFMSIIYFVYCGKVVFMAKKNKLRERKKDGMKPSQHCREKCGRFGDPFVVTANSCWQSSHVLRNRKKRSETIQRTHAEFLYGLWTASVALYTYSCQRLCEPLAVET